MKSPMHPSLYQANTRVWLTALPRELGRKATLGTWHYHVFEIGT